MTSKKDNKQKAVPFRIPGGTMGLIYPDHPHGEHTIARVTMRGRYPAVGYSINKKCSETLIMLKGAMRVRTDDTVHEIRPGDVFVILPRTRYRIEGKGEAVDVITPRWDKKQNKIISDKSFTIEP